MADRLILLILLPLVAAVGAFWFLLLAPKREEAAKLASEVSTVQARVDEAKAAVSDAEGAREGYRDLYRAVVRLGKAVPADDDTASLYVQLDRLSKRAGVEFRAVELRGDGASPAEEAQKQAAQAPAEPSEEEEKGDEGGDKAAPPPGPGAPGAAPAATESAAALLPLGTRLGPGGFPTHPYTLTFHGSFSKVASFIHRLDRLVRTRDRGRLDVRGRLLTIDGFTLEADPKRGFPSLKATFRVTSYLTSPEEGATGGAQPTGPEPAGGTAEEGEPAKEVSLKGAGG